MARRRRFRRLFRRRASPLRRVRYVTRHRHRYVGKHHSMLGGLLKYAIPAAGVAVFLQQVNSKDLQGPGFDNLSFPDKLKSIAGNTVGRVFGWYPFPQLTGTRPFQPNWMGPFNNWTYAGIIATLYGHFAPRRFPMKGIAERLGKTIAVAGFLGGFFDPAAGVRQGANFGSNLQRTIGIGSNVSSAYGGAGSHISGFGGTYSG